MDVFSALSGGTGIMVLAAVSAYRKSRLARRAAAPAATTGTRSIIPAEHGLVPRTELTFESDDPTGETAAAIDAARAGDWRPAAAYLAQGGTDWELRWRRLGPFYNFAIEDDGWLQTWRREQPGSAEAALLHADALVGLAWEIRSSKRASEVSAEQFESFHRVLREAESAGQEAIRLAPADDPNPYVVLIGVAMGLGWDNDRFRRLWSEIVQRAPLHWRAHDRALQYWCRKWRGSHELMHGFIDSAIATAPAGSLISTLKIQAYREQFSYDNEPASAWERPEVSAAIDTALADLRAANPAHPRINEARGLVAYALVRSGRGAEAVEVFRSLGTIVPWPWTNFDDPIGAFVGHRADAVIAMLDAKPATARA